MLWIIFVILTTVSVQGVVELFNNASNVRRGSCRHRSIRQAEFHSISTGRSMSESFVLDDVEYKLCKYHVTWDEALVFCSNHKARLATLDSEEKTAFVVQAIASSSSALSEDYWIGARKLYRDPWTWNSNGMRVNQDNEIINDYPVWYPGVDSNDDLCLTIDRSGHDQAIFVPRACSQRRGFICQRATDRALDNKIRMVSATRVGEQEFRLYAGKATWVEAVVLCRHEGLQIGEVNTQEEARAVAISMLRNRPEGIESAWIGGYTRVDDPITWRWLASGKSIKNEDMWRRNLSESSGGCLLLDRHVCESPVYVESPCDRKRDILCQKPPKKSLSKNPVAVFVQGCPYWIGFHPLKWSDARLSCESLNSTLVVLDSPATITHMMRLMLDNKAELRHIWTDGRRSKSNNGHWEWAVTGDSIPDFAKGFIPWCPEDDFYTIDNACLNLDRENLETPLVYGLSCREKQTYVCQPRIGDCVVHSTTKFPQEFNSRDEETEKTFKFSSLVHKNLATLPMSTVTTPFPTPNVNYAVIQTTLREETENSVDLITQKSEISEKNSTSGIDYSQYLTSLSRFTLPSLPQFGLKIVSATETTQNSISYEFKKKKSKVSKNPNNSSQPQNLGNSSLPVVKKIHYDTRKSSKLSAKSSKVPQDIENGVKVMNSSRPTQVSLHSKSGFKNSSKSSKSFSTTSAISQDQSAASSESKTGRTRKYSNKTTRDLYSSNVTKATTSKTPEALNTQEKKIPKITPDNSSPKSPVVKTTPSKNLRPIIGARRQQNFQATTPYDVIDDDYYDDDDDEDDDKNPLKKIDGDIDEYSDDYELTPRGKKTMRIGANEKNKETKFGKESDDIEDEDDDEGEVKEVPEMTTKPTIPMVENLSKNLEDALVNIMKKEIEKKANEQVNLRRVQNDRKFVKSETSRKEDDENFENGLKSSQQIENFSMRPYYAFEGPFVMSVRENFKSGLERAGDKASDKEFRFIGKKISDENYRVEKKLAINATRRLMKQPVPRSPQINIPISMAEMPAIQPNDPSSLMQLGRYFKNKFGSIVQNSDDRRQIFTRNDPQQRRYGISARGKEFSDDGREEDSRKKGQRWEKQRRPNIRELDRNYYDGNRRLYPRGNYDGNPRNYGEFNEKRLRDERERLNFSWPDKNFTNYDHFDRLNPAVSPRSFPTPIRTTRSFNDDSDAKKNRESKKFPDFRLSKLVKEVKIDLDQRMLKRYLEGFARKIAKNDTKGNRWKSNWRELLGQVLSVFDKMNINVNGDVMKLRAGRDDRKNEINSESSENMKWKTSLSKQRKNSVNNANENLNRKINETSIQKLDNRSQNELYGKIKSPYGRNLGFVNKISNGEKKSLEYPRLHQLPPTNYSNFSKLPNRNQQNSVIPVFSYRPLVPQIQRRIIFRPRWPQIRANIQKKTFFNGENLPEGTLSRIVGSEYKNQHYGKNFNDSRGNLTEKHFKSLQSSDEKSDRERKINDYHLISTLAKVSDDSGDQKSIEARSKILQTDDKETRRNEILRVSPRNFNESFQTANDREVIEKHREVETNPAEDYERKPIWSPAHRLTKALELSVLRKFGGNSANSLTSKNLVTRSIKDEEFIGNDRKLEDDPRDEQSVVSLRMIMNPDKKSSRISRQSSPVDSDPETIELRVQFNENKGRDENRSNQSIRLKNQTFQEFSMNNKSSKDFGTKNSIVKTFGNVGIKKPIRFIDNQRRRAMLDRFREQSINYKKNYLKSHATSGQNMTNIVDPRDRKSRNIGVARKNLVNDVKAKKEIPTSKHYIATSLRNFDEQTSTNKQRKTGKSEPIDWADEASALFTDLKETSDDLTLYIDLTLGRVGSKLRNGGRSRG